MSENIGKWAQKLDLAFNDLWVLRFATVGALCVAVLFLLPASSLLADVVSWGCMVPVTALIVRFVYLLRLPCGRWKRSTNGRFAAGTAGTMRRSPFFFGVLLVRVLFRIFGR